MRTGWRFWTTGRLAVCLSVFLALGVSFAAAQGSAPSPETARLAERGEAIFQQKCSACHSVGEGDRPTGPDLQGVTERRDRQWLLRIIREPERLAAEEDPQMADLLERYPMTMPDLGISEAEAEALLAFLAHPAETDHAAGEATTAPQAAAARGDAERGRALFAGDIAFAEGGAPCLACHGFAGMGSAGNAAFGTDLTDTFENYGAEGVASVLSDLPFPTMEPIYAERPLTGEEQADLAAFLRTGEGDAGTAGAGGVYLHLLIGFALLQVLTFLAGFKRLRSVRGSLLDKTFHHTEG